MERQLRLDLHVHSQASFDGRMTVEEIVAAARAKGMDGVAICDHDVVYTGPTEVDGMLIIPGVEFSTERGHLLGLFVDRPMVYTTWKETVAAIHQAGGLAVLAHPFERGERDLEALRPDLDGLEAWNSRANRKYPKANDKAFLQALLWGLPYTAGSDAHVRQEVGNGYTTLCVKEATLPAIRAALAAGEGRWHGKESSALHVAQSQYTKLRKTHAPLWRYGKWAAFVLRCLWQDGNLARVKRADRKRGEAEIRKWEREKDLLSQEALEKIRRWLDDEEGEQDSCP